MERVPRVGGESSRLLVNQGYSMGQVTQQLAAETIDVGLGMRRGHMEGYAKRMDDAGVAGKQMREEPRVKYKDTMAMKFLSLDLVSA
jgi:hypothetical protein